MSTWILSLMLLLQPPGITPWWTSYERTAETIAQVSKADPVFSGVHGADRTAALLVALGWFESRFRPDAVGDHGRSLCMLQVGESNLKALGVTREAMLTDLETCLHAGLKMIRTSFAACGANPLDERLGHYAAGGQGCRGIKESKHRLGLAMRLFRDHPPPAAEALNN
jgi:hypothetical protein